jgi:hypothetical protein
VPETYGPLWAVFSGFITWLGHSNIDFTFFLFKLFGLLGNSLILFLIYKITKLLSPQNIKKNFFLYAWSPFVLLEFINNAHNDVWMIFFGVIAFYFYHQKKDSLIIPSLVLAGLIKYVYWALIPLFCIFLWREKRINKKTFVSSILLSVVLFAGIFLPFLNTWKGFQGLWWQVDLVGKNILYSPIVIVLFSIGSFIANNSIYIFSSVFLWLSRLIFIPLYLRQLFLKGDDIVHKIVLILFFFVFLVPSVVYPWYIIWWLPFLIIGNKWQAAMFWIIVGLAAYPLHYSVIISLILCIAIYYLIAKPFAVLYQKLFPIKDEMH